MSQQWLRFAFASKISSQKTVVKIYGKWAKIGPKSSPKWTKILENRALGLSWSTLGSLLAPRWRKSDNKSENQWNMSEFRVAQGGQNGAKIDQKSNQKWYEFWERFRNDFFSILGRSWCQKPLRNERSEGHFFDIVAKMRKVWFWITLQRFSYVFRFWRPRFWSWKGRFFSCFIEGALERYFF